MKKEEEEEEEELCKFSAVAIIGQGGLAPHFGLLKIFFWSITLPENRQ